jgi:hypothetical protein
MDTPTITEPRRVMRQEAPYPEILDRLVRCLRPRPGWKARLADDYDRGQGSRGLTLIVTTLGYDTYHLDRGETYQVNHLFPVPPAAYNLPSWQNWLLERLCLVGKHEEMELFAVADSPGSEHLTRPVAPNHGFGWDPYLVTVLASGEDRRTSFRNELNPGGD